MFVINWFKKLIYSLSMFKKDAKILFLGLENAGKTSIMLRLTGEKFSQTAPTGFAIRKEAQVGKVNFKAFDLGGQDTMRKVWGQYFESVNGIVYVVDSADHECLSTSAQELERVLHDPKLDKVPIVVFGNKIDKISALSEKELAFRLGLIDENETKVVRKNVQLFMCSAGKNAGIYEGFEWFSQQV